MDQSGFATKSAELIHSFSHFSRRNSEKFQFSDVRFTHFTDSVWLLDDVSLVLLLLLTMTMNPFSKQ